MYLRKTDGSPAVRLGDGLPQRFSPDGKWALTDYPWGIQPTATPQLLLLPTGAGQPVTLTHDSISHHFATLLPDGKRFLFEGSEPGHALRNWVQDVTGGRPLPITPEGTVGKSVSPDGKLLVAVDGERKFWLYPTDGGQPRALSGIEPEEETIRWSADGKDLFVANYDVIPAKVYQIEVSTGRRQLVYNLAPKRCRWFMGKYRPNSPYARRQVLRLFRLQDSLGFVCREWIEIGTVTARSCHSRLSFRCRDGLLL